MYYCKSLQLLCSKDADCNNFEFENNAESTPTGKSMMANSNPKFKT